MLDDNAFGADALREVLAEIRRVAGDDGPYAYTIRDLVAEALAVPKRNCDRFATAEEAARAYRRETEPDRQNADCYWPCIFDWLFAPAERKEAANE